MQDSTLLLQAIQDRWAELIQLMRAYDTRLQALLRSGGPVAIHNNEVFVRFKYEFHFEHVSKPQNLRLLERCLEELFGQPINVYCLSPGDSLPDFTGHDAASSPALATAPESLKQSIELQRRELETLTHTISVHTEQAQQMREAIEDLRAQRQALTLALDELNEQKRDVEEDLQDLRQTLDRLSEKRAELATEVEHLQGQKAELETRSRQDASQDIPEFLRDVLGSGQT